MATDPQVVHLKADLAERAGEIARARGQSLDAFVDDAVSEALAEQEAFEEAMAEADRDFEAGRVHSHEEVLVLLAQMRAEAEAEIARRKLTS
jgi:predicted transcriptional regulator